MENIAALGTVDPAVTANTPLYAVFRAPATDKADGGIRRILVVHNADAAPQTVTFSNGAVMTVPARTTASTAHVEHRVLLPIVTRED